jgi:hypothetical protein
MEIEAVIPPIHIQFDRITRFYGVRVLKLYPDHLVRKLIIPPKKANQQAWIKTRSLKRNKLKTQLKNIMVVINDKRGYYQLESFKLQRDMLWKRTIEYLPGVTIQISEESKDETAKQHIMLECALTLARDLAYIWPRCPHPILPVCNSSII